MRPKCPRRKLSVGLQYGATTWLKSRKLKSQFEGDLCCHIRAFQKSDSFELRVTKQMVFVYSLSDCVRTIRVVCSTRGRRASPGSREGSPSLLISASFGSAGGCKQTTWERNSSVRFLYTVSGIWLGNVR